MSLTTGGGPLSYRPAGTANFRIEGPAHKLYLEPSPRRLRAELAGELVVDTVAACLLHETGLAPVCYVPVDDVTPGLLEPSDTATHCPFKGDARYWHVRAGGQTATDAAWAYPDPLPEAPDGLASRCAIVWSAMSRWLEEDAEVHGGPRNPYVRVDTRPSRRHVVVRVGERVLADTRDAVALFETGRPVRWYLPVDDVDTDRLTRSPATSACPYKGVATHYAVADLPEAGPQLVWSYPDPLPEADAVRDRLCVDDAHDLVRIDTDP